LRRSLPFWAKAGQTAEAPQMAAHARHSVLSDTATFDPKGDLRVVIETPKGSRNKYDYDPECDCLDLATVLPEGMSFPFDFGFVPSTLGEDGDPLDVLVLMDAPVVPVWRPTPKRAAPARKAEAGRFWHRGTLPAGLTVAPAWDATPSAMPLPRFWLRCMAGRLSRSPPRACSRPSIRASAMPR
jgi:hypothetical protein